MDLELAGKVAIVTGGSHGLGRGIAMRLAEEGAKVVTCARGAERLEAAVAEMRAAGGEVDGEVLDLTEPEAAARLVEAALTRHGRLDILVNNVGGNRRGEFHETTDEDWEAILDLNLTLHVRVSRAAVKPMIEQGAGVVLFVASVFGREAGGKGLSIYNTTKSALISLGKIMSMELGPRGIRVNSLSPGSIRFPGGSWDRRCIEDPEGMARFVEQNFAIGRFGTAEEVADVAAFLVSERSSLITGACISADGGQSRSLI